MKKIGFIDYYLSEWHAINYPAWIKNAAEKMGVEYEIAYGWAEREDSPFDGRTSTEWCRDFGVEKCATIEELCEKSDFILILAPSDPDVHLGYASIALKYGKPTYIDKTFAPDSETSDKIISIARENSTPFFSTSALRFAEELSVLKGAENIIITGGGSNLPEYVIHMAEMAVIILGDKSVSAEVKSQGKQKIITVTTENGKHATLVYASDLPYTVTAEFKDGKTAYRSINSDFFSGLIADILRFYETSETSFPTEELREVMHMRDLILRAE